MTFLTCVCPCPWSTAFKAAPRFVRSSQLSMAFDLEKVANSLTRNKVLTKVRWGGKFGLISLSL
jgi:hypothetical protein